MIEFFSDPNQLLSLAGAVMVLTGFLGAAFFKMDNQGMRYAVLNFVGTFLLALAVLSPFNLGVFLVEAVWSVASLALIIKIWRKRSPAL